MLIGNYDRFSPALFKIIRMSKASSNCCFPIFNNFKSLFHLHDAFVETDWYNSIPHNLYERIVLIVLATDNVSGVLIYSLNEISDDLLLDVHIWLFSTSLHLITKFAFPVSHKPLQALRIVIAKFSYKRQFSLLYLGTQWQTNSCPFSKRANATSASWLALFLGYKFQIGRCGGRRGRGRGKGRESYMEKKNPVYNDLHCEEQW